MKRTDRIVVPELPWHKHPAPEEIKILKEEAPNPLPNSSDKQPS